MGQDCQIHEHIDQYLENEKKMKWVALISFLVMVVEIIYGKLTGSMSLLADGWHMASHTLALFLSVFVYYLFRSQTFRQKFSFGGGKILSLGGYTSSLMLLGIALTMIYESIMRFFQPEAINYQDALIVTLVGFIVNLVCAGILHEDDNHENCQHDHHKPNKLAPLNHQHQHHHHHHSHDHNHESAYMHVLSDALTSVLALIALFLGYKFQFTWADSAVGLLGGLIVLRWSYQLIKQSAFDLLDAHDQNIDREKMKAIIENDGSKLIDLHLWRISPEKTGCELVIHPSEHQNAKFYRQKILASFTIHHLIIEVSS